MHLLLILTGSKVSMRSDDCIDKRLGVDLGDLHHMFTRGEYATFNSWRLRHI